MTFGPYLLVECGCGGGSGMKHRWFVEMLKASNNSVGETNVVTTALLGLELQYTLLQGLQRTFAYIQGHVRLYKTQTFAL